MSEEYQEKHLYTTKDKLEELGYGEWIEEPDDVDFKYRDYNCNIHRSRLSGSLCGYIQIPKNHLWNGKGYDDIDVFVHGGLTFSKSGGLDTTDKEEYWIGFDCAHSGDIVPRFLRDLQKMKDGASSLDATLSNLDKLIQKISNDRPDVYRNVQFCIDECKSMVDQAIAAQQLVVD